MAARWREAPDAEIDATTSVEGGLLVLRGNGPSSVHGHVLTKQPVGNVVVDAMVRGVGCDDDEGVGLVLRHQAPARYVPVRLTPVGLLVVTLVDGDEVPIVVGGLPPTVPFHPGGWNRLTAVGTGVGLGIFLNGAFVTSLLLDDRYLDGYAGVLVEQRHEHETRCEVAWFEVREIVAPTGWHDAKG